MDFKLITLDSITKGDIMARSSVIYIKWCVQEIKSDIVIKNAKII